MNLYADVVLPLPLQGLYTYSIPSELEGSVSEGGRVVVQFGKKKFYTAIVFKVYRSHKKNSPIKEILSVLENYPIVTHSQLKFWEWVSFYYMCSLGDVYRAALPSLLKLESETYIYPNPDYEEGEPLSSKEKAVFCHLSSTKGLSIAELGKQANIPNVISAVKSLADKGAAFINENIQDGYSAKTQPAIRLSGIFTDDELTKILDSLVRAKKQQHLLSVFLYLNEAERVVLKRDLLNKSNVSSAVLSELVKKEVLEVYDYKVSRFDYGETNISAAYGLNAYQQRAYQEIIELFKDKEVALLHGVTSSGKTEIYIQLINSIIRQGRQVLYLLPEIALTTQITNRLKAVFGNKLAVYHSKFNENERAETWNNLLNDKNVQVVLGARSAIFLPFRDLGLVIVDEEHEGSYKQQDPAPRYNAKNASIVLAGIHKAKVLLGTATPSIETYYNALTGKYGLVELSKRHENIELPHIEVINTKELRRKKQMKSFLSPSLIQKMEMTLLKKEQVILFQNRRGFASMLECKNCSWTPRCAHCDVSLTYHKGQRMMVCHYCGATYSVPTECPECKTPALDILGYGTERVEEEVSEVFPEASVARMDLDTTRGKRAYEYIISRFEENKTNILIGTQMVSKGLDFDNVSIVGILNADNLLNYPDFRAYEKAFQLMTQVSGRAGRKNKQGLVVLQTSHPSHPLINYVKENNFPAFYQMQLEERKIFKYPPFYRLISVVLRSKDESLVENAATQFAQLLRQSFGERVLGPGKPPVSRVQSLHIRNIMLKIENSASVQKVRETIHHCHASILDNPAFKSVLLHYDVDPM